MGCSHSTEFVVQDAIPGQDTLAFITFQRLHLDTRDVNTFYKVFRDIDATDSNIIRVDEFLAYFRLEKTQLHLKLFGVTDIEHHGYLTFSEMVCLVWDFLSREPTSLGSFAFYLFDEKRANYLEREEIIELITVLHHTKLVKRRRGVEHMVDDICNRCGEIVDVIKFDKYCKQNFVVCGPIVGLQQSLRKILMGSSFWHGMECLRKNNIDQMDPRYVHGMLEEMNFIRDNKIREEHVKEKYQEHAKALLDHIASVGGRNSLIRVNNKKDLPKEKRKRRSSLGFAPVIVYKKSEKSDNQSKKSDNHSQKSDNHPKKSPSLPIHKSGKVAPNETHIHSKELPEDRLCVYNIEKMVALQEEKENHYSGKNRSSKRHSGKHHHQHNVESHSASSKHSGKHNNHRRNETEDMDEAQIITAPPSLDEKDCQRTKEEKLHGSAIFFADL